MTPTATDYQYARAVAASWDIDYLNECIAAEPFQEPPDELTTEQAEALTAEAVWSDKKAMADDYSFRLEVWKWSN